MQLSCPECTLTWYPGSVGSFAAPLVILDAGDKVIGSSPLSGQVQQLVQAANYPRAGAPDFWPRGNKTGQLRFTRVTDISAVAGMTAGAAGLQEGLTMVAGLPETKGWLHIAPVGAAAAWSLAPAVIRAMGWETDPKSGRLLRSYQVDAGELKLFSGAPPTPVYTPGEIAPGPTSDRGAILMGPNRTA